jgi:hypothetical protein
MLPFLFLMAGLAHIQIRTPFHPLILVIDIVEATAGLPESHINLNYQKEPFDRYGNAKAPISLAAAWCLIRKTNWLFFSH